MKNNQQKTKRQMKAISKTENKESMQKYRLQVNKCANISVIAGKTLTKPCEG